MQSLGVHNTEWWRSHVGQDLSNNFPIPEQPPVVPEAWRQKKETAEGKHEEKPNPRKEFEANVLRQVIFLPPFQPPECIACICDLRTGAFPTIKSR